MYIQGKQTDGVAMLAEIKEFGSLAKSTQRYIRRSLDLGLRRQDAVGRWARDPTEAASIREQGRLYRQLERICAAVPDDSAPAGVGALMGPLIACSGFDLGQNKLPNFAAYRFLYERLIGAAVRPWLPSAYCAAAALPHIHPATRLSLLRSIGEAAATAAGWSIREPAFFPEWVEKVELAVAGSPSERSQ